jgi:hypothetical protein
LSTQTQNLPQTDKLHFDWETEGEGKEEGKRERVSKSACEREMILKLKNTTFYEKISQTLNITKQGGKWDSYKEVRNGIVRELNKRDLANEIRHELNETLLIKIIPKEISIFTLGSILW